MGKTASTNLLALIVGLVLSNGASAQSVSLRPSLEEEVIDTKIGGRNAISMGLYADSNMLLSHPFSLTTSAGGGKFSYQVPIGIGLDLAWGLSARWEFAVSAGYQKFESREVGGPAENFVIGGYTAIPVRALLRYRWPEKIVAPEIEIAGGANFQRNSIKSTVIGSRAVETSSIAPYAHVGGGISYAWGNDLTIHFIGGYAALMNGSKRYTDTGGQYDVKTNTLVHGIFTKGMVRVQF